MTRLLPSLCIIPFALAAAQGATSSIPNPYATSSPPNTASGGNSSNDDDHRNRDVGGLAQYYFVFLVLVVMVFGLGALLFWRRKKKMSIMARHHRHDAVGRDIRAYYAPGLARGRYWQGRWRSTDVGCEEGLDENGEAPPPYVPKPREADETAGRQVGGQGPAVPLQTLSRDKAGLKPPGYHEALVCEAHDERLFAAHAAGSSQDTAHQSPAPRPGSASA